jgi:hypothetical protein
LKYNVSEGNHNPLVGGSNPPAATIENFLKSMLYRA